MKPKGPKHTALTLCLIGLWLAAPVTAGALTDLDPFLMDAEQETALARSAAPEGIGGAATVMVLTPGGFEEAAKGDNGFVCLVERSWSGPAALTSPADRFLNQRVRAPICYNPAASRTILPKQLMKTRLLLEGHGQQEIADRVHRALLSGELPAPAPSAMAYMLSAGQYLGDRAKKGIPHLMLYVPYARNAEWGGFAPGQPQAFILEGEGGPEAVVIIPASRFVEVADGAS